MSYKKKIIDYIFLNCIIITFIFNLSIVVCYSFINGDINNDGIINLKEAIYAMQVSAGLSSKNQDNDNDGFSENEGDCDDSNNSIYPNANEICDDNIDQDCNGVDLECSKSLIVKANAKIELPSIITLNFYVLSNYMEPVIDLDYSNFSILEDDKPVSLLESNMTSFNAPVNYDLFTLLMFDLSGSVDLTILNKLVIASKQFVDILVDRGHKIAIWYFQSDINMVISFSNDKLLINEKLNLLNNYIKQGASTNLYGAFIKGIDALDNYETNSDNNLSGNLVLFSDGGDTAGKKSYDQAQEIIYSSIHNVFTIGLITPDMSQQNEQILINLGKSGYESAINLDDLSQAYIYIADRVETENKKYYVLSYSSPKRDNNNHILKLFVTDNIGRTGYTSYEFSSSNFTDGGFMIVEDIKVLHYDKDHDGYYSLDGLKHDCNDNDRFNWISCQTSIDNDNDSFPGSGADLNLDCNDDDDSIYPGAVDLVSDNIDSNCDGIDGYIPITNSLSMTFVNIPAGSFTMGSPETEPGRDTSETQHEITITKSFYMQTTEVTQAQWQAVMNNNPAGSTSCDLCPIENISYSDIQSFIININELGEGFYRLPTEAEWEYTARSGAKTAFFNGEITSITCSIDPNLDEIGWFCGNSNGKTHPVAQKISNSWGLYDMNGNVWELCSDYYGNYPKESQIDPTGPLSGKSYVVRGGAWISNSKYCRSASRGSMDINTKHNSIGFRLVKIQ